MNGIGKIKDLSDKGSYLANMMGNDKSEEEPFVDTRSLVKITPGTKTCLGKIRKTTTSKQ